MERRWLSPFPKHSPNRWPNGNCYSVGARRRSSKMKIGIVGAGRIAQSLGRLLNCRGANVIAIASRTIASAEAAASFIGSPVQPMLLPRIASQADHLLLAVTDGALTTVAQQLADAGFIGAVLHTSGSAGLGPLAPLAAAGAFTGVLHPLQTVPTPEQGLAALPGSYFTIGGGPQAVTWAADIVALLEGHALQIAPDAWPLYHAAAVMASNYQCALIDSALELLIRSGIDSEAALSAIAPIVRAAARNILSFGPVDALTGPIQRGDTATVQAHLAALAEFTHVVSPETRQLYIAAGLRALPLARKRGLSDTAATAIHSALTATHS